MPFYVGWRKYLPGGFGFDWYQWNIVVTTNSVTQTYPFTVQ
jgi:hypothetical protein